MRHNRSERDSERSSGGRLRHGEVRAAILTALASGPAHGYELGLRLERASGGAWRPSPGSIYPTLQALADEDFVTSVERDGKRIYTLTRDGEREAAARVKRGEETPWTSAYDERSGALREAVHALKGAARQLAAEGSAQQRDEAITILTDARKRLYEILAR